MRSFLARHALAIVLTAGLGQAAALSQSPPPQTKSGPSTHTALLRSWADRLRSSDAKVRATAEAALVKGASGSLPVLRRLLDPRHEDLHKVTFEILQRIGPPAIPLLVDLLRHDSYSIRRSAVDELIDLAPETASIQPALRRALRDEDSTVAGDAARALGALGRRASPSATALVNTLSHDDPYVRVYAAEALASIGPNAAGATNALARALDDPVPGVRWAACEALASIGPAAQSAAPQLIDALNDEFLYVRIFAAGALGSIGPRAQRAREALTAAASDPALRDEAEWALSRIAGVTSGASTASRRVPEPSIAPPAETTAIGDLGGTIHCLDAATGAHVWKHDTNEAIWGSIALAADRLYVGNVEGTMTVLRAGRRKQVLARIEMDAPLYSPPALNGDALYLATANRLYRIAATAPSVRPATEIRIFTARAIATVLAEIGRDFERETGHKLIVISDLPTGFQRRVTAGESFDLMISGSDPIDEWIRDGRLVAATRTEIARSGVGVEVKAGSPRPDIGTVEAFKRTLLNAKSIAYLRVGSGIYLHGLLDRLGISADIRSKVTRPDSDVVSELVAKGEVEVGMTVITQILTTPGVELVGPLPEDIQHYVTFVAAVGADSNVKEPAYALIKFLKGSAATAVMKTQGMEPR